MCLQLLPAVRPATLSTRTKHHPTAQTSLSTRPDLSSTCTTCPSTRPTQPATGRGLGSTRPNELCARRERLPAVHEAHLPVYKGLLAVSRARLGASNPFDGADNEAIEAPKGVHGASKWPADACKVALCASELRGVACNVAFDATRARLALTEERGAPSRRVRDASKPRDALRHELYTRGGELCTRRHELCARGEELCTRRHGLSARRVEVTGLRS
jgi:hypothetical protein